MNTRLIWSTPDGDDLIAYMARVSNPDNQHNTATASKLISYLIRHKHWSPFEMVNACFEIKTSRSIGRQLLRHRSFSFQEFSQRYAEVDGREIDKLGLYTKLRVSGTTNRQSSVPKDDPNNEWFHLQYNTADTCFFEYRYALDKLGVAPELARNLLPEGLTPTTLYMNGTLRSWLHYIAIRSTEHTQLEHREIAFSIANLLRKEYPNTFRAFERTNNEMGSEAS